jgi:hypothetical protein
MLCRRKYSNHGFIEAMVASALKKNLPCSSVGSVSLLVLNHSNARSMIVCGYSIHQNLARLPCSFDP